MPGGCADGDVRTVDAAGSPTSALNTATTPEVYYNGQWHPVCGHEFWDNNHGATTVCKKLGFASGTAATSGTDVLKHAMMVGECRAGEPLTSCTGGKNMWGNLDAEWCGKGKYGGRSLSVKCVEGAALAAKRTAICGAGTSTCSGHYLNMSFIRGRAHPCRRLMHGTTCTPKYAPVRPTLPVQRCVPMYAAVVCVCACSDSVLFVCACFTIAPTGVHLNQRPRLHVLGSRAAPRTHTQRDLTASRAPIARARPGKSAQACAMRRQRATLARPPPVQHQAQAQAQAQSQAQAQAQAHQHPQRSSPPLRPQLCPSLRSHPQPHLPHTQ